MPVGVVDVAKEVEVGEQHGHRRLYGPCLSQLAIDRQLEVLRVEEPCLGIASGLMLEQRNLEPLAKQQQRCDGERSEPRVRQADGRQRRAQRREQELGTEA